jgi:hypothetical protein
MNIVLPIESKYYLIDQVGCAPVNLVAFTSHTNFVFQVFATFDEQKKGHLTRTELK